LKNIFIKKGRRTKFCAFVKMTEVSKKIIHENSIFEDELKADINLEKY